MYRAQFDSALGKISRALKCRFRFAEEVKRHIIHPLGVTHLMPPDNIHTTLSWQVETSNFSNSHNKPCRAAQNTPPKYDSLWWAWVNRFHVLSNSDWNKLSCRQGCSTQISRLFCKEKNDNYCLLDHSRMTRVIRTGFKRD